MVCAECEKKQKRIITPDTWKAGARNTTEFVTTSNTNTPQKQKKQASKQHARVFGVVVLVVCRSVGRGFDY